MVMAIANYLKADDFADMVMLMLSKQQKKWAIEN
jgi:hypothetical protein